jgi:hypothetical protein
VYSIFSKRSKIAFDVHSCRVANNPTRFRGALCSACVGEIQSVRGEIQPVRGETQSVRGENQPLRDETQSVRGEI